MILCGVWSLTVEFKLELCADYRQMDISRKKRAGRGEDSLYMSNIE